ncbi:MAG: NAD(P)H-binding protein [Halioglobus sp.]
MHITIFGSTGAVGHECLKQSLAAGHSVKVLVRNADKLPSALREDIDVLEGDALNASDVFSAVEGADAVLFAIGVDKHSPENLCTDVTRLILNSLRELSRDKAQDQTQEYLNGACRFIWCGGGSTFVEEDKITFGAKFVRFFASTFMGLRHRDKEMQWQLLKQYQDIPCIGVRPLQIKNGEKTEKYQVGFIPFSGTSSISFADVAHAMLGMLNNEEWLHKAPIVRY